MKTSVVPPLTDAGKALEPIKSGQRVLVGSGAAEPEILVKALAERGESLADTEVLHLLTLGTAPYAEERFAGRLRHNALFIGSNVRGAVGRGLADYTPCFLSELPSLIRSGRLPVDAALVQTTPVEKGKCSLGVAVDIVKAAVESAPYVVAQVNPRMPWTEGDSLVNASQIDAFVPGEQEILELPEPELNSDAVWIGRYVAALVEDGATIQAGIGAIPNAVLAALAGKKDLGVHSEMISDGILSLIESGTVTGRRKTLHPGKIVISFCLGSRRLYDAVDRNPLFEFRPSDYVNSPAVIARNERMVAVNSALQIDLTGQVAADSIGHRFYSGVGGQVDFIRGAALSPGGRAIIALPSTAKGGAISRIVPSLTPGTGVVTTRADVDFVVTEFGIASLKAKTVRERAVALIQIAHPSHRPELLRAAKAMGCLDAGYSLPPACEPYHVELETRRGFAGRELHFRPLKPSDERRLKELFYSQSLETTYLRYGVPLTRLSEAQFRALVAMDGRRAMALAGFAREGGRERMVAVGRYFVIPGTPFAECAFTVHDDYQGLGIGSFLLDTLSRIASDQGLEGFQAKMLRQALAMRRILARCFCRVEERDLGEGELLSTVRFADLASGKDVATKQIASPQS